MNIPGLHPAVAQQRDQGALVGALIRRSVHAVRIVRGVADLIGVSTFHNTQNAVLRHPFSLSSASATAVVSSVPLQGHTRSTRRQPFSYPILIKDTTRVLPSHAASRSSNSSI